MTQPINKCYKRVYVHDIKGGLVVGGKAINDIDSINGTDLSDDLRTDAFGNQYYNYTKGYVRTKSDCTPASPSQDFIRTTYEKTLSPRAEYPGFDYVCLPCSTTGKIPTPVPNSPASCAVFVPDAGSWQRMDIENNLVVGTTVPGLHQPMAYVERNVDNEIFINDCSVRQPVVFLVPEEAGGLVFTFFDGVLIARVEGEDQTIESEVNTTILVPAAANV